MGNSTFGSKTTAEEALNGKDLSNNVIIVTGANSGLGKETTRVLVKYGATVIMACRSAERGKKARNDIINSLKNDKNFKGNIQNVKNNLDLILCDLVSLNSVRKFCKAFSTKYNRLNYLINNAGIMAVPEYRTTKDGFELQYGVNYIGHYYLTLVLTPLLISGKPSRVILVSSSYHSKSPNPFDKYLVNLINKKSHPHESDYNDFKNFAISKAAIILFARQYNELYRKQGITAYSVHPGVISTNLSTHRGSGAQWVLKNIAKQLMKTIEQGAATQVRLVGMTDDELKASGGHYFRDCQDHQNEIRKDMKRSKYFDEITKQFYCLTKEIIQNKGISFSLNSTKKNNNFEEKKHHKDENDSLNEQVTLEFEHWLKNTVQ